MNSLPLVLSLLSLLPQVGVAIHSGTVTQNATSKDCALNIANVNGNVVVQNCPGIPIKALEGLNRELKFRRLSEVAARQAAEEWREKYEVLQATLASAGLSQDLLRDATLSLQDGDLNKAAHLVDDALKQQDRQVDEAASSHFLRAKIAELEFDRKTESAQFEIAYRLVPHSPIIAGDYGIFLTDNGHLREAEAVFDQLLQEATAAKVIEVEAATLINTSAALQFEGRFAEAKENQLHAASLWEACYKQHQANSLNNEATAYSAAARIAVIQQHFEEASEFFSKSIMLERSTIKETTDPALARNYGLNLADTLMSYAEIFVLSKNLDVALSMCAEAATLAIGPFDGKDAGRSKIALADAKTKTCYLVAMKKEPEKAETYCDDALSVISPLKDSEDGRFLSSYAQASFVKGLVQEDKHEWKQAVLNFTEADAAWGKLIEEGRPQYRLDQVKAVFYLEGAAYNSGDQEMTVASARRSISLSEGLPVEFNDFRKLVLQEAAAILDHFGNKSEADFALHKLDLL